MLFLSISIIFFIPYSQIAAQELDILSDEFIDSINKKKLTWRAKRNWPKNTTIEFLRDLSGTKLEYNLEESHEDMPVVRSIPREFNAADYWPHCKSTILKVPNQGRCGSCWAVQSAAAMTDRVCIASEGKLTTAMSAEDLLTCCESCWPGAPHGCVGGSIYACWKYWISEGVVTGGMYKSEEGCKPLSDDSFNYKKKVPRPKANCQKKCSNEKYHIPFSDDKRYGQHVLIHYDEPTKMIQNEIMLNGPVVSIVQLYDDFHLYGSGVYRHHMRNTTDIFHALRIIGWGVENDVPYWLIVNSWGENWGDLGGLMKILRGQNESMIEKVIFAGVKTNLSSPQVKPKANCAFAKKPFSYLGFLYILITLKYFI